MFLADLYNEDIITKMRFSIMDIPLYSDPNNKEACVNLYHEIKCLSRKKGYCDYRNSDFASKHAVHARTIQRWFHALEEGHLIEIRLFHSKRGWRRKIYIPGKKT